MIQPSTFTSFGDNRPREVSWREIYTRITSTMNDVYTKTQQSLKARSNGDMKEAARLKSSMGFFTPCVQMTNGRKESDITAFTQHGICDFDHISRNHINLLMQRVAQDPHTRLCYITNSQEGIRVVFRWRRGVNVNGNDNGNVNGNLNGNDNGYGNVNGNDNDEFFVWDGNEDHDEFMSRCLPYHQRAWIAGNLYYQRLLDGAEIDEHCKDPNRISFYSHDLHAFYNDNPEPFMISTTDNTDSTDITDIKDSSSEINTPTSVKSVKSVVNSSVKSAESVVNSSVKSAKSVVNTEPVVKNNVDESIILRLLDKIPYKPSHRHGWWIKLGSRLKYFNHNKSEFTDYKTSAIRILKERKLILPDDPSVRSDKEVNDAIAWGYEHSESLNTDLSDSEEDDPDELIANDCPLIPDEVYQNLPLCLLDALAPVLDYSLSSAPSSLSSKLSTLSSAPTSLSSKLSTLSSSPSSLSSKLSALSFKKNLPRRRADALLLSLLTNYSVLCSNVHLLYGDHDYSPNLGFICLAPAGNGKSVIEYAFRIIESTDRYLERISNEEHKAWEEQMLAYEQTKTNFRSSEIPNSRISELPNFRTSDPPISRPGDEPQMQMLAMPGTTSRSQFTICMNAMGQGGLIMNSTEINTLISTLKLDVGNFVDLLCKAMMNEQITQFFKIDNKPIKIKHPKLSVCMSGTFDQFHNFIHSIEDGLYSRFFVMMMEQHTVWISQKPDPTRADYSDVYKRLSDEALEMWLMLNDNPTWVMFTDEQWAQHTSQYSMLTDKIVKEGYHDRAAVINRHGLGQMRIAAVLTAIRKYEIYKSLGLKADDSEKSGLATKGDFKEKYRVMVCRDDDFQAAAKITECLLPHALQLSTTMTALRLKHVMPMRKWHWVDKALASLPKKFTIKEWINVADSMGRSLSQAYRSIKSLEKRCEVRQKTENNVRTYYKTTT